MAKSIMGSTHNLYQLEVEDLTAELDVLSFKGEEWLSQPFKYTIAFTSQEQDIEAAQILGKDASFYLGKSELTTQLPMPDGASRTVHGVITGFKRVSGSRDEARYQVALEAHLALLGRGKQYRIYQHQSVPEIVESILRSRHQLEGQHFVFDLAREYPKREQVMQYGESDLTFISRLLAEVGIWYRFTHDDRLYIDVVEFHDHQRHYQFGVKLPHRPLSGLTSNGQDGVWALQVEHQVVEQHINVRAYHHRDAAAFLDGEVDHSRGATTTYGEGYHYGEPYTALGDAIDQDEDLLSESGYFYARLNHERFLNDQTRCNGVSSSVRLAPGQVLTVSDGAPQVFEPGVVITHLTVEAARDRSLEAKFDAIPYSETIGFRPSLLSKPQIAGTVPARVTSTQKNDPYGHIDMEGRYRVIFLFDRDTWRAGEESVWLRLARPYAGDTHGLHLPLICGTEVAVAFEQGDPDRPYIAHALHDSEHPDHVTLRNYKRNVLRTPANNKFRLDDTRGQEHIKLSTEHGGKSQLNLGHVVDAERKPRGAGAELRTDGHVAVRGGSGIFISADTQPGAKGHMLEMAAALERLEQAKDQLEGLSDDAQACKGEPADVQAQLDLLKQDLEQLKSSVLLLSAPQGISLTSGGHLQLAAQKNLMLNVGGQADMSVVKRLFVGIGQGLSVFVRKLGIKLIANQGPISVQAQNDSLSLIARHGLEISSTEDEIRITAKKKITLNAGGSYISIDACSIESGTEGDYVIKCTHFERMDAISKGSAFLTLPTSVEPLLEFDEQFQIFEEDGQSPMIGVPYKVTSESGKVWLGRTDSQGRTERVKTPNAEKLSLVFGRGLECQLRTGK
ncbi:type VI secretion system Vgr family protein [Pseudomonas sp. 32_A]|uniref:type VI secretion system Vgr family protein n=1 Tax=Pseudomonas sp. 32_A TaxID=2813559 RepID=UPI001FB00B4F|nr:type VI secretion system tip protein VgrG [Pseudomonas sp. 32_A]